MKTLKLKILLAGLACVTAFSSCMMNCVHGSGNQITESRKVADFTSIDISGGYDIVLKQDSSLSLKITADDNVMQYLRTEVNGDKLKINTKKNICAKKAISVVIGVRNLEEIKGAGAIEIKSDGKLNVKDLNIKLSGAGKVDLDLNANNLTTRGSGATELILKGQASSHNVNITGSGKLNAFDFVVGKYDLETTGASDCKINVLTDLNVHSTGAADIQYKGNPTNVNTSKTGAASIKKVD
ncbi:DUF2807 domain-containing protein [Mucilaginibacter mali]|uniref:DUF2807 domain-containing protein n=1 Tax=Mucilaginibacter mali TaxID=2740462 RepID=A0A7D4QS37_9SPHI|nr:head GIN domain-containing protein [Mucilaginibacter mali]QKJ29849.1 DUF2807 domain-containing protein [Mucilaginibacter mali]